jgi:uncharacterized protein YukJ
LNITNEGNKNMSLTTYGVLKCRALERKIDPDTDPSPHYQVLVSDGQQKHRIAINVKSQESPSDLLYLVNDAFQHPILNQLVNLGQGFHPLQRQPGGGSPGLYSRQFVSPRRHEAAAPGRAWARQ